MDLTISQIRLGHATNSSSSHSVIIDNNELHKEIKNINETLDKIKIVGETSYNWEDFSLTDREDKLHYLALQLKEHFEQINIPLPFINGMLKKLLNMKISDKTLEESNIDHQSIWRFPNNLPYNFYEELRDFISQPYVTIYGGNDNSDDGHEILPHEKEATISTIWLDDTLNYIFNYYDGYWTMYNKDNGNKIKMSFIHHNETCLKSDVPELVDIKITDQCRKNCNWCYMDSNIKGNPAKYEDVTKIISSLKGDWWNNKNSTFEIAFGGGEPTLHPDFKEILKYSKGIGITPNFSTYSKDWLEDIELVKVVLKNVGGIGISIHSEDDLEKLYYPILNTLNIYAKMFDIDKRPQIIVQHVFGNLNFEKTTSLIKRFCQLYNERRTNFLLLGPKYTGRASENSFNKFSEEDINFLIESFGYNRYRFSVDTSFAKIYGKNMLEKMNIHPMTYQTEEGKFSCYINAVEGKIGKSSYDNNLELLNLKDTNLRKQILEKFSQY
jgi:MoaA/NifB/PqqE/SkfB family radical SAM enzyme